MAVHERLDRLFDRSGVSQADVAEDLEVTASAVSAWRKGERTPSTKNLRRLAEFFDVSFAWLAEGEGELMPDLEAERAEYTGQTAWVGRPAPRDGAREYGSAAATAFEPSVAALAGEAVQNIGDAKLPNEPTVDGVVTGIRLTGEALERFKSAVNFEQLERHLEAAAMGKNKLAKRLQGGLDRFRASGDLMLLRFDDYGSVGLTGDESGTGHFAALVKNELDTTKGGGKAGSHGQGKSTYWAASEFSTVLFNSLLSEPDEEGRRERRIIGRAELPWHECDEGGSQWAGQMWFGAVEEVDGGEIAVSYWGSRALAVDLCLEREDQRPGTSVLVVGFRDPAGQSDDFEDLLDELSKAIGARFFPALMPDEPGAPAGLRVEVRAADGADEAGGLNITTRRQVVPPADVAPYADALEKYRSGETVGVLENPGDVTAVKVAFKVPRRRAEPEHDEFEHDVTLLVRAAGPDEGSDNTVLLTRGARMVVDTYTPQNLGLGVRPFHAVLLAGEASGDTAKDILVEQFLRVAEPPAHDSWQATPELGTDYVRGGPARIKDLMDAIRSALKEVVGIEPRDLSDGPQALKDLLRIKVSDGGSGKGPDVRQLVGRYDAESGSWIVDKAAISLPRIVGKWSFRPVLVLESESGGGTRLKWDGDVEVTGGHLEDGQVIADGDKRRITISGRSHPSSRPEAAEHARATVELKHIQRIGG